jgi:hypothetical protein
LSAGNNHQEILTVVTVVSCRAAAGEVEQLDGREPKEKI